MEKTRKSATLTHTYYRSFLLLIVIPLVLVFVVAEAVIGYLIRNASIETIDAVQENIATVLSNDARTNALQLSHFVYVSDGEFMQVAAQVSNSTGDARYEADQALQKVFRTAMVPSQNIIAGCFYMKDGGAVYMKEDMVLPQSQARQEEWYQAALQRPNTVVLGGYDSSRIRLTHTTQKGKQFVIVTALATDMVTDKSGEIEVVAFCTVSQIGDLFSTQRRDSNQGFSVILDGSGHVIYGDMGNEEIRDFFEQRLGDFTPGSQTRRVKLLKNGACDYFFRTRTIPDTDWSVVTFTEEASLGQRFYEVGSLLALVVIALLVLFYLYSRYFLNSIITPVHTVCEGMARLDNSDLNVQLEPTGHREIRELMSYFNQMVLSIKHMIAFTEETEKKKHEAEILALQSQINPHFIVNTLNSIRFMAQVAKFDGIRKMAEALVNIVSCSFRSNASFYTVREELEMLDTYVCLMRIRYSNGFEVSYDVQEDCLSYMLPRLTLQPVVENSITHGFDEMEEELGQIRVSVYQDGAFLCLSVWDNGRGMSQEKIARLLRGRPRRRDDNKSIGLENVLARIRLNFGEAAGFEIESELGKFTRIVLKLPLSACIRREEDAYDKNTDRG